LSVVLMLNDVRQQRACTEAFKRILVAVEP
jgi:hypothetical protein